ncbi:hypothetical protein PRO82_001380 [Candidatus Protochlamydia amoebophila]|nr:hypothetical protein [Candidatus Protochlamydia amoebophila]
MRKYEIEQTEEYKKWFKQQPLKTRAVFLKELKISLRVGILVT